MSGSSVEDKSDGSMRMLGIVAQGRGDAGAARLPEEIETGVPQQGEDGGTLVTMNEAGILPEVDVFGAMASIFNEPVPATQLQEPLRCPHLPGQTGNPVPHLPMLRPLLPPVPLDPEDLGNARPVRQDQGIGGGAEMVYLPGPSMPLVDGPCLPSMEQWSCFHIKDPQEGMMECGLVRLHGEEIVAVCIQHLLAEGALTKERITDPEGAFVLSSYSPLAHKP